MTILERRGCCRIRAIWRVAAAALSWCARKPVTAVAAARDTPTPESDSKAGRGTGRAPRRRLAEGVAALERLEAEREDRNDPGFGRAIEDRIVWRQLIELELQDIDEQLDRIRSSADRDGWGAHARSGAR